MASRQPVDPINTLREYRQLAPWNVRDLSTLASALLDAAGVRPASSVAADHPTPRTIRYYVANRLLTSPNGRGPTATYAYQHLLEVLSVKLRQVEGQPLKSIAQEIPRDSNRLEREIVAAVGDAIPAPNVLQIPDPETTRGKAARVFHTHHALGEDHAPEREFDQGLALTKWHRVPIVRGLELHIHEGHPLAGLAGNKEIIGSAVKRALGSILRAEKNADGPPGPVV